MLKAYVQAQEAVKQSPGLVCFWDFQEQAGQPRRSVGAAEYPLYEVGKPINRAEDGLFGPYAADVLLGQWFNLPRSECPLLNFHGKQHFTIHAWLRLSAPAYTHCQAVAGMWNETGEHRQYCMFLNLRIWDSAEQVCGHVSYEGGPTPGYEYCMSSAIGSTPISKQEWHMASFTYDGHTAKVYLDGKLDIRAGFNPYPYPQGLHDGGTQGSDFTVAAVNRSDEPGNFYEGLIGGLGIYNRAWRDEEIAQLAAATLPVPNT